MGEAELHSRCHNSFRPLRAFSSLDLGCLRGRPLFCVIPVFDPRPDIGAGDVIGPYHGSVSWDDPFGPEGRDGDQAVNAGVNASDTTLE